MRPDILAIDFGTSNSAAAILENGAPRRLPIQSGSDTLPTAVFFPGEGGPMLIGDAAGDALIAGEPGRYMRALKSVLGGPLLRETRMIGGARRTLADVITVFLRALRERAEAATGARYRRALSGRPVHFHTADPERDARAEADLRACYLAAGFDEVAFLAEPEAAALACRALGAEGGAGLVVDIGGGTSDFTAFVVEGGAVRVLASHGIRLGGTDFDQAVSMTHAMPLLGLGGELRREMGPGLLPVPKGIYADLATWAKIPFLYTPATRREAALMARLAVEPARLERLARVLDDELGHELAFAVERGKIAANENLPAARIAMEFIEPGLAAPISPDSLALEMGGFGADLRRAAEDTLALAGLRAEDIGSVILVGGSSLMRLVTDMAVDLFPGAALRRSEAFTAVVDGLALATGEGRRAGVAAVA
ncbi:MAG: hsp70 family protein [Rhodovulum sulfidophilum]|uniref:Hsp70 family protein n=1 Tax=Rhodovulum sulfidophilum TaxID=35806 RepID=A0A2W5MYV7_RHOSU|nr:MAG: hsp70 family protein [Rhodovulum sulfidophilum]